mmetsp:Transcript_24829/g.37740  ORF Transcript_24829/g.37740 Transcript_24829/m.37740 type:complete len:350 (-) Transcript_24829:316-1365(-)
MRNKMSLFFTLYLIASILSNTFCFDYRYAIKSVHKIIGCECSSRCKSLWCSKNLLDVSSEETYQTLPRLYVGSLELRVGETFEPILSKESRLLLDPNQAHYVTKVMRIDGRRRSQLRIFDGNSGEWLAKIDDCRDKRGRGDVFVQCQQQLRLQPPKVTDECAPWIIFAPLKKARTKLLIEKCTELGSGRFLWIKSDRTDSNSLRDCQDGQEKLMSQIVEASEQCERLTLPHLSNFVEEETQTQNGPYSVSQLLDYWQGEAEDRALLICRERSPKAGPILSNLMNGPSKVAFLIGPEGGWSPEEEACFEKAEGKGAICSVSLGSSVLRAETAAIAATSIFQAVSSNTVSS